MKTKRSYIKWNSPKAINTVKKYVKESPEDLKGAFQKAADELNTTFAAVFQAWHAKIKHSTRGYSTRNAVKPATIQQPMKSNGEPIYETVVSTQEIEGMRVVTVRQYYLA